MSSYVFAKETYLKAAAVKENVYEFVKNIPRGKVATYGQIALCLGNRNFARAVGNILHRNPDPEHIPGGCKNSFFSNTSEIDEPFTDL